MSDKRWHRNELRDEVWQSKLCVRHKMVMLAVLHFMDESGARPGLRQLATAASMGQSTVCRLLQKLVDYDWLTRRKADVPGLHRQPNLYLPPRLHVIPETPDSCGKSRPQTANLRRGRGTNGDAAITGP